MIRVLHVTEDHSPANTGIAYAVDALTRCMPDSIQTSIACAGEETIPVKPGVRLHSFPTRGIAASWRFSPHSAAALEQAVDDADVVQVHGLWMWPQWAAARRAYSVHKPVIVTPHGMLESWIWRRQSALPRLRKYLYWKGIAYPVFKHAAVVHALTEREAATLQSYFPGQKLAVIPHGIDLHAVDGAIAQLSPAEGGAQPPYFLFMGRLHPVKGVHLLIRAFSQINANNFVLKIAGPVQSREQAYADSLHRLTVDLGLEERVIFTGAVGGAAKWRLYRDAWAFCLPSFSEVIGLVNLEAAAARTPVITTFETGVVAQWDQCGGLRIHPQEEAIRAGLVQSAAWSQEERWQRGEEMRTLVEQEYSWQRLGKDWASLYGSLAGGGAHE